MGYIFGRIKNSLFYKKYIKELGITKWARSVRDEFRRLEDRLKGRNKYPDLIKSLSNVYEDKAFFSMKEQKALSQARVDIVLPVFNGYDYLIKLLPNLLLTKI